MAKFITIGDGRLVNTDHISKIELLHEIQEIWVYIGNCSSSSRIEWKFKSQEESKKYFAVISDIVETDIICP